VGAERDEVKMYNKWLIQPIKKNFFTEEGSAREQIT